MASGKWLHCSDVYLGDEFVSELRVPACRPAREAAAPRLCVAPTVAQCFAGRLFEPRTVYVYAAECGAARAPQCVWDRALTDEHWIVHRQRMVLDRQVAAASVVRATEAIRLYHQLTGRNSDWRLRLAQLAHASAVLCQTRRWILRAAAIAGIGEPEDYIIAKTLERERPVSHIPAGATAASQ